MSESNPSFAPLKEAALLHAANDDVRRALENVPPATWSRTPAPGEWSAAQIVGHMIELEPYWARVAGRVAENPGASIGRATDDPDRLAGPQTGAGLTLQGAVDRLTAAGKEAADILRAIAPQAARKTGHRQDGSTMTVQQIVQQFLVAHAREHARQLLATLGAE